MRLNVSLLLAAMLLTACGGGGSPESTVAPQQPVPVDRLGGCNMGARALLAGYGEPLAIVDAADFDGTNDYMSRGALTGAVNSKTGIFSAWLRIDGGDGTFRLLLDGVGAINTFHVELTAGNNIQLVGFSATPTQVLTFTSAGTYLAGATWLHILASWDLATGVSALYINSVFDSVGGTTDAAIAYTAPTTWYVGRYNSPSYLLNGCLAEVYFAPDQYLDFSVAANRQKFISASGKPVHLGTNGSLPTGTAPIVYLHLDNGEAVANFAINRGTGGNFTINGTLTTASSSPSD